MIVRLSGEVAAANVRQSSEGMRVREHTVLPVNARIT